MKLGMIVAHKAVIEKLRTVQLPAKRVFRLRKAIKALSGELRQWEELKGDYIREHGKQDEANGFVIEQKDPAFEKYITWANEVLGSEVDRPKERLSEEDLEHVELSVAELEAIEALGLLSMGEEEKQGA
jgi:hypothetical protein